MPLPLHYVNCVEELTPGALLVQYTRESGPPFGPTEEPTADMLEKMADIGDSWERGKTLTYEAVPRNTFYRERLVNPFRQKIGASVYRRSTIDPVQFFQGLQPKPARPAPSPPSVEARPPAKKQKQHKDSVPSPPRSPTPSSDSAEASDSETEMPSRPNSPTSPTDSLEARDSGKSGQPQSTSTSQPQLEPISGVTGSPAPTSLPPISGPTGNEEPPRPEARFRPRRHPATYQPTAAPVSQPVSCLLFRPLEGGSLHLNRAAVARELQVLKPKPVAVRRIREGGLAVDFPLGQALANILTITTIDGVGVKVQPPLRRQGTSGVIRGDFTAAEEVYELYSIHAENPTITKVDQLGDKQVFRLFFSDTMPSTVTLFFRQYRVEPYYQHPVRCFRCSGFNHRAADCKRPARCSLCAAPDHSYQDCPKQLVRCVNCGGPHPATSKTCPHRLFHLKASKTAANTGVSIQAARAATATSYADAVRTTKPAPVKPVTNQPEPTTPATPENITQLLTRTLSPVLPKEKLDALLATLQFLLRE